MQLSLRWILATMATLLCSLLLYSSNNEEEAQHTHTVFFSSAVLCVFLAALLDDLLSLDVHEQKNVSELRRLACCISSAVLIHTITVLFKSIPYNKPRHTQYAFLNNSRRYKKYSFFLKSIYEKALTTS